MWKQELMRKAESSISRDHLVFAWVFEFPVEWKRDTHAHTDRPDLPHLLRSMAVRVTSNDSIGRSRKKQEGGWNKRVETSSCLPPNSPSLSFPHFFPSPHLLLLHFLPPPSHPVTLHPLEMCSSLQEMNTLQTIYGASPRKSNLASIPSGLFFFFFFSLPLSLLRHCQKNILICNLWLEEWQTDTCAQCTFVFLLLTYDRL